MTKPKKPATTPPTDNLMRHPLSETFSLPMGEDEREALAEHIAQNKQIQPIVLFEGLVLDGWERYLACRRRGITPEFKTYDGPNPAAVAFGANVMRRRLSAVQKALMGAKYLVAQQERGDKITQKEVAKLACCSLARLNAMVQLMRAADGNPEAARALSKLNTNPDVTYAMVQDWLVEAGIVDQNARGSAARNTQNSDDGTDGDDTHSDDADAAVDSLLDDVDELLGDDVSAVSKSSRRQRDDGDSDDDTTHGVGTRRRDPAKKPTESPASALAKSFKALTEPERVQFVVFAWGMLRPALEKAVTDGRVEFPALGVQVDSGKSVMADMAAAITGSAPLGAAVAITKPRKGRKATASDA